MRRMFSMFLMLFLTGSLAQAQDPGIESIPTSGPDGASYQALAAGSPDASAGVLVVHDWFGISDLSRSTLERLASQGYRAVAVDLYQGESATDHERAGELMNGLVRERADAILQAGLESLKQGDRSIAVVGFSMGGYEALHLTLLDPEAVDATVVVYGGGLEQAAESLDDLEGPVLIVTGTDDSWAMDSMLEIRPAMAAAGKSLELYAYPNARHAFAQPLYSGGDNYDTTATRVSWMLIDDFLARHLLVSAPQ